MPELPEVECLARSIRRIAKGGILEDAVFFREDLREPIPIKEFRKLWLGETIDDVTRRSKYLLLQSKRAAAIFHLGMSGKILCYDSPAVRLSHTHAVFTVRRFGDEPLYLHYVDPRRFGFINCCRIENLETHRYFAHLGPEPLENRRLGQHLFEISRSRHVAIKQFIMDAHNVVGVGNIYANEALFRARIHPNTQSRELNLGHYQSLARAIQTTLRAAIKAGGTTFRDFLNPDGNPGYFSQNLSVYGREGEPCRVCGGQILLSRMTNRATYHCNQCQIEKIKK